MVTVTGYDVVVLSDLHLGMNNSKPKKILKFLESIETNILILNGDIIDIDALNRNHKWKNIHTKVITKIMDISRKSTVIYIRGNHDDDVKELYGSNIMGIIFCDEYILERNGMRYLIFHGDKIDVSTKWKFLTYIGSIGYDISLKINNWYNSFREWQNLPYHSISKIIKENVKEALSFVNNFEQNSCDYAKKKNCSAVICGHIHIPTIKQYNGISYMNSGDWVENFSALCLTKNNEWRIISIP